MSGGRYRLGRSLGRGAMGQVVLAHDRELNRDVALKFLHGEQGGLRLERLRREAEVCARLRHPGIVRLHGTTRLEGREALIYELVPGARPLNDAWRGLDLPGRVRLVRDAARALGHAHGLGIVHRDVKPANLLVDERGQVKVTDFGLAAAADLERLTQSGTLVGTPHYMAPEQVTSRRDQLGPATDVWALGVILYEAVQDALPFQGNNLLELAGAVAAGSYPPLRAEAGALAHVVTTALAKAPATRHPDAAILADELERWLRGERVGPRSRPSRKWLLAGLTFLTVGLIAALSTRPVARAPAPVASASPSGPRVAQDEPELAWRELEGLPADLRLRGLHTWLRAWPQHRRAGEAAQLLRTLGREHPLFSANLGVDEHVAVAWRGATLGAVQEGKLLHLSPTGETLSSWSFPLGGRTRGLEWLPGEAWLVGASRRPFFQLPDGRRWRLRDVRANAVTASGDWLAVGSRERGRVVVLRTQLTGDDAREPGAVLVRELELTDSTVHALLFTPERDLLLATTSNQETLPGDTLASEGHLQVWRTLDWERLVSAPVPTFVAALDLSREEEPRLALGTRTGQVMLISLAKLLADGALSEPRLLTRKLEGASQELRGALAHQGWVESVAWRADGRTLYTLGAHEFYLDWNQLVAWDMSQATPAWIRTLPAEPACMRLAPDQRHLALGYEDGLLEIMVVDW